MSRLPVPGGDNGTWGNILNDFLSQSLNATGGLIGSSVSAAGAEMTANKGVASGYAPLDGGAKLPSANLPTINLSSLGDVNVAGVANSQVLSWDAASSKWIPATVGGGGTVPDATTSSKGIVQLAGDIAGSATSVTVTGLQGRPVASTAPSNTNYLGWSTGSSQWQPTALPTSLPPSGSAGGDLTGTYPNPTLAAIGLATGPIGDATTVPVVTIDTKGRVTGLTSTTITGVTPGGSAGGDLTGTYPNPTLAAIGSATGPIGDGTHVPVVTIDTKGRVTALTSTAITGAPPSGSAGGDLTGTYPNPTLATIGSATGPIGSATTVPIVTIDAKGRVTALTSTTITGVAPAGNAGGDLGSTYPNPQVVATHLSSPLPVAQGGSGAATLTGLVKGNGTSAFTAAVAGTDYLTPTGNGSQLTGITGSQISGNISGNAANVTGTVAIANGGTGQTTAALARGTTGLNIESRSTFSDANYTAASTDRLIAQIGTLSASRTVTLMAANAVPAGYRLRIQDESNSVTSTNTIVITAAGADKIDGSATYTVQIPYFSLDLVSDGSANWIIDGLRSNLLTRVTNLENSQPRMELAYAEITTSASGTQAFGSAAAISGLSATATVASRPIKVIFDAARVFNSTSGQGVTLWWRVDGGSWNILAQALNSSNTGVPVHREVRQTPSAGSHTYDIGASLPFLGSGTWNVDAGSNESAFIQVIEC